MSHNQPLRLDRIFQKYDPPLFFVTFCTARRRSVLANDSIHRAFIGYGRIALDHNIALGRYVIMPDHIHLFVRGDPKFNLGRWIGGLKRVVAAAVTGGRYEKNSAPKVFGAATTFSRVGKSQPFWQRGFFDHLIQNGESYAQKWDYVRENPLRAGLVSDTRIGRFKMNCGD